MLKSWIGFGDLDLIFKITQALKLLNLTQKKRLSAYLINWLADFNQVYVYHHVSWYAQHFQGHRMVGWWWGFGGDVCFLWKHCYIYILQFSIGERGGSVVECRTPEREVRGSRPTVAVLCPWARHFTPRKYWLITQEAMAPSRYDWKIVDWDVKPQHNQQPTNSSQ